MDIEKEREAFSNWHESEYGEHVTWWDEVPASHIHNDRWCGWKASALRAAEKLESCVVVPVEPTEAMYLAGITTKTLNGSTLDVWNAMVEAARGGK